MNPYVVTYSHIISEWIKGVNIRYDYVKLWESGEEKLDTQSWQRFSGSGLKIQATNVKIGKWDCTKLKTVTNKRNNINSLQNGREYLLIIQLIRMAKLHIQARQTVIRKQLKRIKGPY